ncbi:hypothetical protein KP509_29G068800 [Ceratopteris richardii]|uniref:VQ domain-containing protein n=1 Tax=Ceratopteris richardii TaxID=49495 RepID=A0A8T2R9M1_CERRI|nr:hypothetical protein KP509_29G068800 [Ceratopteris richardii]
MSQQTLPIIRIVEEQAPTIVYSDVANFRSVVQNLTGWESNSGYISRDCNPSSAQNMCLNVDAETEASIAFSRKCSLITFNHFPKNGSEDVNHELRNPKSPSLSESQPFEYWELSRVQCRCATEDMTVKEINHDTSRPVETNSNEDFSFCKAREEEQYSFSKAGQHSQADHDMVEEIMSLLVNNAENQEISPLPEILSDGQELMYLDASVCSQSAYLRENYMFMQP